MIQLSAKRPHLCALGTSKAHETGPAHLRQKCFYRDVFTGICLFEQAGRGLAEEQVSRFRKWFGLTDVT